jgi:hypothetical protein
MRYGATCRSRRCEVLPPIDWNLGGSSRVDEHSTILYGRQEWRRYAPGCPGGCGKSGGCMVELEIIDMNVDKAARGNYLSERQRSDVAASSKGPALVGPIGEELIAGAAEEAIGGLVIVGVDGARELLRELRWPREPNVASTSE